MIKNKNLRIGLALGGGGARGIAHIEYLKVLDELGIKPTIISGTSIGSIIGALYASGLSAKEIEKIFINLDIIKIAKLIDLTWWSKSGFVKGNKIENHIKQYLKVENFEDLKIPLKIVATNFWSQKQEVFSSGKLMPAIRASSAIPAFFNPIKIKNKIYIDGGVSNPVPFDIISKNCDYLIAIDVLTDEKHKVKKSKNPSAMDIILSTFITMQMAIIQNQLEKSKPDLYLNPSFGDIRLLDFHKAKRVLKLARKDAKNFKQQLIKDLKIKINK